MDLKKLFLRCVCCLSFPLAAGEFFWEGNVITDDPVLFCENPGQPVCGRLLTKPDKIIRAASMDGSEEYIEGKDYLLCPDSSTVVIPEGSRIRVLPESERYPRPGAPRSYGAKRNSDRHLFYDEQGYLPKMQVLFTYRHSDRDLPRPEPELYGSLPGLSRKLKAGLPVECWIYGDSISAGYSASGFLKLPPYQETQYGLLRQKMSQLSGNTVKLRNFSKPGESSAWALANIGQLTGFQENGEKISPDVVILAWGINDVSLKMENSVFIRNLAGLIAALQQAFPETDIIVLTAMFANPDWTLTDPAMIELNARSSRKLAADKVAVVDAAFVWKQVLERKEFLSLMVNGINHPNDFGHRIFADTLFDTVLRNVKRY